MAGKLTMNGAEIAKYHKLLKAEVPKKDIAAVFRNIDPKTLARFTPEAMKKTQAERAEKIAAKKAKK